jgi:hypothetical protein
LAAAGLEGGWEPLATAKPRKLRNNAAVILMV